MLDDKASGLQGAYREDKSATTVPLRLRLDLIWLDTTLSTLAKMVAISILLHISNQLNGLAYPSRRRIARDWGISDRQVTRAFAELEARRIFRSSKRPGGRGLKQWCWEYSEADIVAAVEKLRQDLEAQKKAKATSKDSARTLDHQSTVATLDYRSRPKSSVDDQSSDTGPPVQSTLDQESIRNAASKCEANSLHAGQAVSVDAGTGQVGEKVNDRAPPPPIPPPRQILRRSGLLT